NMFRNIPEEEALGTATAASDQVIRYFNTAPSPTPRNRAPRLRLGPRDCAGSPKTGAFFPMSSFVCSPFLPFVSRQSRQNAINKRLRERDQTATTKAAMAEAKVAN